LKLVIATANQGKLKEIKLLVNNSFKNSIEVLSLNNYPDLPDIIEDGKTFKENAVKKAKIVATATGCVALADDSGLEVDYLKGAPGVHSARFAGKTQNDQANIEKLLRLMEGVPMERRTARFRCVIAIATPKEQLFTAEGTCYGFISLMPRGKKGFGYDPVFYVPRYNKTFAELDLEVKNKISHRARALAKAIDILKEIKTKSLLYI
jgi:XTP/dITP diphosphohydrolase